MPTWLTAVLLLLPFLVWDATRWWLRQRGDRSAARRARVLRHFTEADLAVGRAHARQLGRLTPFTLLLHYAFFLALLPLGLGARLEAAVLALCGGSWVLALPLFLVVVLLGNLLLHLPHQAYVEFVIQRRAGLSTISVATFFADLLKGLLVGSLLASGAGLLILGLLRALPAAWPLPAAGALLGASAFLTWIAPWVIAPLWSRFSPLADEALQAEVRELLARAGLHVALVQVMDASRRSTMLNAYFTGLGRSRRVVLYDTLVNSCTSAEILSVVAHEAGHWLGRHISKGFLAQALGLSLGLLLLQQLLAWPAALTLLGLPAPHSLVLLVALPLFAELAGSLSAPLPAALSRRFERAADRTALDLTADPGAFISLLQKLVRRAKADLLTPRLLAWWSGSHPLPEERIAAAMIGDRLPVIGDR